MMNNDRGIRRKIDFAHAKRKKQMCLFPWYDNLHQYSKNKIHCSCWMCNRRKSSISAGDNCVKHYSISDQKKFESFNQELQEFEVAS